MKINQYYKILPLLDISFINTNHINMSIINKKRVYKVKVGNPIGNLYRKNHVLILVKTSDGKYILGKKAGFYPDHIARFIGGGVDLGELPIDGAVRELKEELKVSKDKTEIKHLIELVTEADTNEGVKIMTTNIYLCQLLVGEKYSANDDVSSLVIIDFNEFLNLIIEMGKLDTEYTCDKFSFKWSDWAKVYMPIHKLALELESGLKIN